MAHYAKDDAVAAFGIGDDVGGAYFSPMSFQDRQEVQQWVEVALPASHRAAAAVLPVLLPLSRGCSSNSCAG